MENIFHSSIHFSPTNHTKIATVMGGDVLNQTKECLLG
jgi:hypothetical protein